MAVTDELGSSNDVAPLRKLSAQGWKYAFSRALREFTRDGCMDLAAALTYRAVFAIFPALLAMVSILGLVGQGKSTTDFLVNFLKEHLSEDVANLLREPIQQLASGRGAGLAFAIGVLGAVWTASNYVVSFGKSMNKILDVQEGRPGLILRPVMYLITLGLLVGAVLCAGILVFSGAVARTVGDLVGLGQASLEIWSVVRWPVLVIIVVLMIATLYYFTPNARRQGSALLSVGAIVALVVLAAATVGFGFYLSNFANYNKTYGSIGGVIALLLWIWIANSVLLLGAEIDAEIERVRQLHAGVEAEVELQLPRRGTSASRKKAEALSRDIQTGRDIRYLANPITPEEVPHHSRWPWVLGLTALTGVVIQRSRVGRTLRAVGAAQHREVAPAPDADGSGSARD